MLVWLLVCVLLVSVFGHRWQATLASSRSRRALRWQPPSIRQLFLCFEYIPRNAVSRKLLIDDLHIFYLDMLVVIVGVFEIILSQVPAVGTLRLVKMLRPLRSIQRVRGMRVLVQCILEAAPQIMNVAIFLLFFLDLPVTVTLTLVQDFFRWCGNLQGGVRVRLEVLRHQSASVLWIGLVLLVRVDPSHRYGRLSSGALAKLNRHLVLYTFIFLK